MLAAFGKKIAIAGVLGSLAACGAFASAAEPLRSNETQNQAGRQNSVAPQRVVANKPVTENMLRPADHEIAQWLMVCNNEEVQLAKLAEQHADHEKVKDFAKQMQTEHTQAWQQLEQVALRSGHGQTGEHAATSRPGAPVGARGAVTSVQPTTEHGGLNYLEIHKQVAAQSIASANRDMGAKKGAEFDKAYIGCQIGAHYKMIDTTRVLREYASPELQKTLDEETKAAEHHLAEAKDIMKSLDQK